MPKHTSDVYKAGETQFQLSASDESLLAQIEMAFAHMKSCRTEITNQQSLAKRSSNAQVVEISIEEHQPVDAVFEAMHKVFDRHKHHLYVEGAVLKSPSGKLVLLAGESGAGKSTLTVCLALSGWSIVSEDIVFFTESTPTEVVSFPLPVRLRGSAIRLMHQQNKQPKLVLQKFFCVAEAFVSENVPASFDSAILLHGGREHTDILLKELSPQTFLRNLLPLSNALHLNDGADRLMESIKACSCLRLSGGSIAARMDAIERTTSLP